jgi:hypothetical protein
MVKPDFIVMNEMQEEILVATGFSLRSSGFAMASSFLIYST